jgi:predicted RNA binding protein with dsRBD fold (UPF0201 family)
LDPSSRVLVTLSATVSPSEDRAKVLAAARNVLGDCAYTTEEGEWGITLSSTEVGCLRRIHDQLRDRHVRAAANRLLLRMRDGNRLRILLNRQAAAVGVIALCTSEFESPLGPLAMEMECESPEAVIEWLTAY